MWTYWYIREASTAIYVANMPMCWTLMRHLFDLRSFNGSERSRSKTLPLTSHRGTAGSGVLKDNIGLEAGKSDGNGKGDKSWWDREGGIYRSESEENIVQAKVMRLEVWETKEFDIDRGDGRQFARDGQDIDANNTRMYDGAGKEFETRTTVTARGSPMGRKIESSGDR
jgi:hypothetical protein